MVSFRVRQFPKADVCFGAGQCKGLAVRRESQESGKHASLFFASAAFLPGGCIHDLELVGGGETAFQVVGPSSMFG